MKDKLTKRLNHLQQEASKSTNWKYREWLSGRIFELKHIIEMVKSNNDKQDTI